jgi:chorismate mutase
VLQTPTIGLAVDGVKWEGRATPITDPAQVREVVEKFRAKYGVDEVAKYYSGFDVAVAVPLA